MNIFDKTPNGIVQHGPCPYCGDWGCRCGAWDDAKNYTVDDVEAIRNHRISKEAAERTKLIQSNRPRQSHLVPGWPFPTRKRA
jgi:hypothetical protein